MSGSGGYNVFVKVDKGNVAVLKALQESYQAMSVMYIVMVAETIALHIAIGNPWGEEV